MWWHTLTIVIYQWHVILLGSTNCVFSCLPVDGLPRSHGQTSELLHIFHVTSNSNFSGYVELKLFLLRRTQLFLIRRVLLSGVVRQTQFFYSTLQRVYSYCSWYFGFNSAATQLNSVNKSAQLCQRVCSTTSAGLSIFAYLLCEKSLPSVGPFILYTPWRVLLFCTLHSVQECPLYHVLRVFSTMSTLDSALLCNSEILYRIVILWLCTA